jgi:hypothetical protein
MLSSRSYERCTTETRRGEALNKAEGKSYTHEEWGEEGEEHLYASAPVVPADTGSLARSLEPCFSRRTNSP